MIIFIIAHSCVRETLQLLRKSIASYLIFALNAIMDHGMSTMAYAKRRITFALLFI